MDKSVLADVSYSHFLLSQQSSLSFPLQRHKRLIDLCSQLGDFLSVENHKEWLSCYARDAQHLHSRLPITVFRPSAVQHIAPFVEVCYQLDIPISIRGGGTGLAGSCIPSPEAVVLLTQHLNNIVAYDPQAGTIRLEPGITVKELNRYIAKDGWIIPLEIATEGVASIAGCLSSNARGYHRQQESLINVIESVSLIDGMGRLHEVPSALVCGTEGLWGVIIEMKVRLQKKNFHIREYEYLVSWDELFVKFPNLCSMPSLSFLTWFQGAFFIGIQAESWRFNPAIHYLNTHLIGLKPLNQPFYSSHLFVPSKRSFMAFSAAFHLKQLPDACQWSEEESRKLHLECLQQVDVLAGTLHIIIQSADSSYSFSQKAEQFLVSWTNYIDLHNGMLCTCHGVGRQMRPYLPPFLTESRQNHMHKLQAFFDPKKLFGRETFFPPSGKSLEKVMQP